MPAKCRIKCHRGNGRVLFIFLSFFKKLMMLNADEIEQIIQISKDAGEAIMYYFNKKNDTEAWSKTDDSPLTLADLASNKVICEGLRAMSDYPIISEENSIESYEVRKKYSYFWLIDPMDGTKEFLNHSDEFTTNIALVQGNEVVAGFVYVPVKKHMYWAVKSKGAYLQIEDSTQQITCVPYSNETPRIVASKSHLDEDTKEFIDQYPNPTILNIGSSIKFLKIAEGQADLYPRCTQIKEWDVAASQIILEEAGGELIDMNTMESLTYNSESLRVPPFIARGIKRSI